MEVVREKKRRRERGRRGRARKSAGRTESAKWEKERQEKGSVHWHKGTVRTGGTGAPWFGNSRGVAILECGEMASGAQEAKDRPVPGHNDSLSVALTHFGLSTPRNTKFTQAHNVAVLRPCSLIATIVFALCPQASRAIKKVVHCDRGLPFTVGAWSPSRPVSSLRRHK